MVSGPSYQGTSIARPPTFDGPFGQAWTVALKPLGQREKLDFDATVSHYIIRAPQSHPFWWMYALSVVHLRPIEGVKPAHIDPPGNTHELMIIALNPEYPVPDLDAMEANDYRSQRILTPPNIVEQFQVPSDAHAHFLGETAVTAIVRGLISPDTDFRRHWKHSVQETARQLSNRTDVVQ